jgi:hypothetical protein
MLLTPRRCFSRRISASGIVVAWLLGFLASVTLVAAQPLELPLGLATGSKEAQLSEDGKQWVALTAVSSLVFDGTMIRTGDGVAWVPLHDATQFELHQCGIVGVFGSKIATVVKIALSRVLFRLPASSETMLATPSVRFQITANSAAKGSAIVKVGAVAPNASDRVGWISVDRGGNSRIELLNGKLLARPVNGSGPRVVEAGQTADFPVNGNGNDADPDFKTLREKALACPCLLCAAWFPFPPPITVAPSFAALGAVGASAAGVGALGIGIGTRGIGTHVIAASPFTP